MPINTQEAIQEPISTEAYNQSVVAELIAAKEYHSVAAQAVKFWSTQAIAASLMVNSKDRERTLRLFNIIAPRGAAFTHEQATHAAIDILNNYKEAQFDAAIPQSTKYKQTNALHSLFTLPHISGRIAYGDNQFFEASQIRKNLREALANRDAAGKKLNDATAQYIRIKDLVAKGDLEALYAAEEQKLQQRNELRNKETEQQRQQRIRRTARQAIRLRVQAEKTAAIADLPDIDAIVTANRGNKPIVRPSINNPASAHSKKNYFSRAYWAKKLSLISAGKYFSVLLSAVFGYQAFSYTAVTLLDLGSGIASYFFPLVFGYMALQNFYYCFKKRKDHKAALIHFAKGIAFLALGAAGFLVLTMSFGTGVYAIAAFIGLATFVGNLMVLIKYIPELLHKTFGRHFGKISPTNTFVYDYENGVRLGFKRKFAILLGLVLCLCAGLVYGAIGYTAVMYSPLPNPIFAWFTFAITFAGICGLGLQNIKIELFTRDYNHWKQRWAVLFERHFNTVPRKLFVGFTLLTGLCLGVAFTTFAALPLLTTFMPLTIALTLMTMTVLGKTAFYARNICFGAAEVLNKLFPKKANGQVKAEEKAAELIKPQLREEQPVSENMESAQQSLRLINSIGVGATAYVGAAGGVLLSSSAGLAATFASWATASREIHPDLDKRTTTVLYDNMDKESLKTAEHPPRQTTASAATAAQTAYEQKMAEEIKLLQVVKAKRCAR